MKNLTRKLKDELRILRVPATTQGFIMLAGTIMLILLALTPFLFGSGSDEPTGAMGYYDASTDEITVLVNESDPQYDYILFHEQQHKEFANTYPILKKSYYLELIGVVLTTLGLIVLRPKMFLFGGVAMNIPDFIMETQANVMSFLEFYNMHSVLYELYILNLFFFVFLGYKYIEYIRREMQYMPSMREDWRGFLDRSIEWWFDFIEDHRKGLYLAYLFMRIKIRNIRAWL